MDNYFNQEAFEYSNGTIRSLKLMKNRK